MNVLVSISELLVLLIVACSCTSNRQVVIIVNRAEAHKIIVTYCNESNARVMVPKSIFIRELEWTSESSDSIVVAFPIDTTWHIFPCNGCTNDDMELGSLECSDIVQVPESEKRINYIYFPNLVPFWGLVVRVPSRTVLELPVIEHFDGGLGEKK